jgi:putative heme transporter
MLDEAPPSFDETDEDPARPRRRAGPWRWALHVAGVVVGVLALAALFPVVSGAPWDAVGTIVGAVPLASLLALVALWAAGLMVHTLTLTAALPGLSHRRALLLSLTGSAVANLLPLGGAAGIALNYRMTRRWGFTPAGFASYTVVTNLWDVLAKLFLPLLLVPLVVLGLPVGAGLRHVLTAAVFALPLVGGVAAALIAHPRLLGRVGARVEGVRAQVADVVAAAWVRLTLGMSLYTVLLFALLAASLAVAGAGVPLAVVLLAFCAERLATLVGLTPGGLGVVEVGLAAALMLAPGADPAGVAAGALLYRALTFGLEIPVGGLLLAGWTWRQRAIG